MIRLKKNGKYFDIEPGETITTEWVSTVFNDEADLKGSYTYTIKAPFTPNNNALLNNAYLIENRSARYATMVTIEVFGQTWKQAKLTFDVTPDGYEMNCLIDGGEFASLIKEKLLPEVFINFKDGIFDSFIFDVLGNDQYETLNTMLDRANNPGKGSCVFISQKNDYLFGDTDGETPPVYDPDYRINIYNTEYNYLDAVLNPAASKTFFFNPSYYLRWVIRKVCAFLGFEAAGDFFHDPQTLTLIIDNTGFIDAAELYAATGGKLAPARHLPAIKVADFLKILRSTFKLAIYPDGLERKVYFNYAQAIITSSEGVDISGFVEPGINIKSYVPSGFEIVQAADDDDALFKTFEYQKTFFIGDRSEPKKLENFAGTLFMTDIIEPRPVDGGTWRIPRKRQVGNGYTLAAVGTEAYNETGYNRNDYAFRLLNYLGVRYGNSAKPYYYATSDGKETDGSEHPTALSCWLDGEKGLINRFMRDWLRYILRTEEVEITAHMPGNTLMQLSPLKKITWASRTRALIPALINQVSFEQSNRYAGKISAKIKVYPIYNQVASDAKAFTEVAPGEVENAGKIYVRYVLEEYRREEIKFGAATIIKGIWCYGYLDFFSDPECTKPRSVTNLPINMIYVYKGANPRNYIIDQPFQVNASGTRHQIMGAPGEGIDQVYHYQSKSDFWNKYYGFNRSGGPDYEFVV